MFAFFSPHRGAAVALGGAALTVTVLLVVPTDVQMPGTQPLEISSMTAVSTCDNCHGGFDQAVEPAFGWKGSTMAQAGRDPLFWAAVALAERDFPGAGDICIRCHSPRGWHEGRSSPSDGSALRDGDAEGVECAFCHSLTNPDGSEHVGVQNPPYVANTGGGTPRAFQGSGMAVLWGGNELHGPYANPVARHGFLQSRFIRSSAFCGTCHDVSNPVTGDLAPGNGAMVPLPTGSYSGQLGGPVAAKAAFLVEPHRYGMVERTFSEHQVGALATTRVSSYPNLPRELRAGAIRAAYESATAGVPSGDYQDGTARTFTCQTCHMHAAIGKGCNKNNAPLRADLPRHDLTGGNSWVQDAIAWLAQRNRLLIGNRLDSIQSAALAASKARARATLAGAASLAPVGDQVRVINLTGHKLLTGYPEGRRLWLHVEWFDRAGARLREDGAYGPLQVQLGGQNLTVESILDLDDPELRIYEARPGISQEWASLLRTLGLPAHLPLHYERITGAPSSTLADAASGPPGSKTGSFRFVLNDTMVADTRIPPYGFTYDAARERSTLPVPASQYGDPGPGGTYRHWDTAPLNPPVGADHAEIELLYQPTSWEYVQFLFLANDGSVGHLAGTGQDLLDAWLGTGMAAPQSVARSTWCVARGTGEDLELRTEIDDAGDTHGCRKQMPGGSAVRIGIDSPRGAFTGVPAAVLLELYPTGYWPMSVVPGLWIDRTDVQFGVGALPANGFEFQFTWPQGIGGWTLRVQAVALSLAARNGIYATTDAHDLEAQ